MTTVLKDRLCVAVGVIVNEQQQVLIAKRDERLHQGGLWEFPGGKVEQGETVPQALARELQEEVGLTVLSANPLMIVKHDYNDESGKKNVLLDVWRVHRFSGIARGCEGQPIKWVCVEELDNYSFPRANRPILRQLLEGQQK